MGGGASVGTLYQELFVRGGVRRAELPGVGSLLKEWDTDWIRWSMMVRAS
mgnify:CR=1 FL=1